MNKNLVEKVAEIIFDYSCGLYPEEYAEITGQSKPRWSLSTDNFIVSGAESVTLAEHERDEYRLQAKKVLEYLKNKGLLNEKDILPKYVTMGGSNVALRLGMNGDGSLYYYRHAGRWQVDFVEKENGELYSVTDVEGLDGMLLSPTTEDKWRESNEGYV